jgi:hypothetical protein
MSIRPDRLDQWQKREKNGETDKGLQDIKAPAAQVPWHYSEPWVWQTEEEAKVCDSEIKSNEICEVGEMIDIKGWYHFICTNQR